MAKETPAGKPHELTTAARKRIQKLFEAASKQITQENYDYATELLTGCVQGDPSNRLYAQTFVESLQKKYHNNRKGAFGAGLRGMRARRVVKKALARNEWMAVITHGVAMLRLNPWNLTALTSMATASKNLGEDDGDEQRRMKFFECELYYLNCAQRAAPKDPDINRQCAVALSEQSLFDQAIACWHKVEQARPGDEEAAREIANLHVKKTIQKGGYEGAESSRDVKVNKGDATPGQLDLSEEERLKRKVAAAPDDLNSYLELGQLYLNEEDFEAAEKVYLEARKIAGDDPDFQEKLMDLQVRRLRQAASRAKQARGESPEAEQQYRRLRKELTAREVDRCQFLCQRYPHNLRFKYDLGLVYQIDKHYNEAIKEFQQAKNDPRCKGLCLLRLGQCFHAIKQNRLAITHYESALEEIPDREAQYKKETLYLAGKLAMEELKDLDKADKHLGVLAGLDFTYKDVSQLLDELARRREEGTDGGGGNS